MHRRRKIQLAITFIAPLLVMIVGSVNYYYSDSLLSFVKASYFFGILLLLLIFCFSIRQGVIGEASPAQSMSRWLLKVLVIEIGIFLLFLMQKQVLLISFVNGQQITILQGASIAQHFFDDFFLNYYLFPWPLIIAVAVVFAYSNMNPSPIAPFSTFVPKKWFNPFITNFIKAAINVYIHLATRLFLSFNLVMAAYFFCLLIGDRFVPFFPIGGMLSGFFLCILFTSKIYRKAYQRYNEKGATLGRLFIRFLISILIVTLLTQLFAQILIQIASYSLQFEQFRILQFGNPHVIWELILWSWWILAIPFVSSFLVRVSKGRRVFTFLIGTLAFPVILCGILGYLNLTHLNILTHQIIMNWILLIVGLLAIIFFFGCLFLKGHQALLQIGSYSLQPIRSKRRLTVDAWWQIPVCLVVFWGLGGIDLLQLICMLVALPCLVIFILFGFWGVLKKNNFK